MPLKVTLVLVLFLMCFPAQDEARTIPLGQNQNRMNNHKDKLFGFGAVQKGEAHYSNNNNRRYTFFINDQTKQLISVICH